MLVNYPGQHAAEDPAADPQIKTQQDFKAELDRILGSECFRHSEVLRRLLTYLGQKWLSSETEGLKEYTIGVEAFGKPSHYDPQEDPAVRVLASKLRHKLEEYYFKGGEKNPFRISMPRGHYALELHPIEPQPAFPAENAVRARIRMWQFIAAGVLVVSLLSVLAMYFRLERYGQSPSAHLWTPELALIWDPFIKGDRTTILSLGTPFFVKFDWGFIRNSRINDEDEAGQSAELQRLLGLLGSNYAVPSQAYTGAGEAMGGFLVTRLLSGRAANLVMQRSSALTWDNIRQFNVIFLGPPKFNLHLNDIPVPDGFVLRDGAIRNPRPRPGEQEAYRNSWANHTDLVEDYALVSRLSELHGSGEIMMIGAGSTEATWAAAEYVTQPAYARELVTKVGLVGGALPRKYQVIIRVKFRKLVPTEISYTTHRILGTGQSKSF